MKAIICCIAKKENDYINDWVNYHLDLGFDHIYIFDNNDSGYEPIEKRIERVDRVTIFDVHDQLGIQAECYTNFYKEYSDKFNWCAFIDVDEFITLRDWKNIKDFLGDPKFRSHSCIRLNMTVISDNELVERDISVPVYEALIERSNIDYWDFGGKQIIKGGLERMTFDAHCPYQDENLLADQITPSGKVGALPTAIGERNENAYIRHFRTKTLSEFVKQKLNNTSVFYKNKLRTIDYFWETNKKTKEKEKWLVDHNIS